MIILGIDTSNYTTSIALVDGEGNILSDTRRILDVKKGERGLRQSDAVFQHMINFPKLFDAAVKEVESKLGRKIKINIVAVSKRPRSVKDSYMPCFKAGEGFADTLALGLGVPIYKFSHQEGHIEAAIKDFDNILTNEFLCWHLSGGTCELLKISRNVTSDYSVDIIGGSLDISIGQLVDRIGVKLGFKFPAGKYIDELAILNNNEKEERNFAKIKSKDLYFNISGIETQIQRYIDKKIEEGVSLKELSAKISKEILDLVADLLIEVSKLAICKTTIENVVFSGGVSASIYLRNKFEALKENIYFADSKLSPDNAVGIALLGRKRAFHESN